MATDLLATAEYLVARTSGQTSSDLCRAQSAIYYALFQTLAKLTADLFVGPPSKDRPERAWRHIYRALEHTKIANKCKLLKMNRFPPAVIDYGDFFLQMQHQREKSDYEYGHSPDAGELSSDIERARVKINKLLLTEEKHLRAFSVFILIEKHRHEEEEIKRARPKLPKPKKPG